MRIAKQDNTNPNHYRNQPHECIEFSGCMNFSLGNSFKYIWRFKNKNGIEDLEKAKWYLKRQIESNGPVAVENFADLKALQECDFEPLQHQALFAIVEFYLTEQYCHLYKALNCVEALIAEYRE